VAGKGKVLVSGDRDLLAPADVEDLRLPDFELDAFVRGVSWWAGD